REARRPGAAELLCEGACARFVAVADEGEGHAWVRGQRPRVIGAPQTGTDDDEGNAVGLHGGVEAVQRPGSVRPSRGYHPRHRGTCVATAAAAVARASATRRARPPAPARRAAALVARRCATAR